MRIFPINLLALVLFVGGVPGPVFLQAQQPDAKSLKAYTIQWTDRIISGNGQSGNNIHSVAINEAGYVRSAAIGMDGKDEWFITIFSPVTDTFTEFRPKGKAKTTLYQVSQRGIGPPRQYSKNCEEMRLHPEDPNMQFVDLGEGTFLGWRVLKNAIRRKNSESETWVARDCNCEVLYERKVDRNEDTQALETLHERMAITITLGNPDPSVFQEPPGYTEMSPSQARIAQNGGMVPGWSEGSGQSIERKDREYNESQKLKPIDKP